MKQHFKLLSVRYYFSNCLQNRIRWLTNGSFWILQSCWASSFVVASREAIHQSFLAYVISSDNYSFSFQRILIVIGKTQKCHELRSTPWCGLMTSERNSEIDYRFFSLHLFYAGWRFYRLPSVIYSATARAIHHTLNRLVSVSQQGCQNRTSPSHYCNYTSQAVGPTLRRRRRFGWSPFWNCRTYIYVIPQLSLAELHTRL